MHISLVLDMPWYLGMEEGTDKDESELYWIIVHNKSISKLFEEIDRIIEKEIPSGCDVRIGPRTGISTEHPLALDPVNYLLNFSEMDDGTFQWKISLRIIKSTHDEHSNNFMDTIYQRATRKK